MILETTGPDRALAAALAGLRERLDACLLPLGSAGAEEAAREARSVVQEIDDHLLPRLASPEAPLLAVLGGSTGAGKSTLVNSLVGRTVSEAGVLRPTTRAPVLVHSPEDTGWFSDRRVLPQLARTADDAEGSAEPALRLVAEAAIPRGLALLDAPDLDSVVTANRFLGGRLLAAADLWVFVTSATRYADAVPWQFLRAAAKRGAAVAVVLDRVPPTAAERVGGHLARLLASQGLGSAPLFIVRESSLVDGVLPDDEIEPVRQWLTGMAADVPTRKAVLRRTLDGALAVLPLRVAAILDALATQSGIAEWLRQVVDVSYDAAAERSGAAAGDGSLLSGRVRARWADFVAGDELLRALERQPSSKARKAAASDRSSTPSAGAELHAAVREAAETMLRSGADRAASEVAAAWASHAGGVALLDRWDGDPGVSSSDLRKRIPVEMASWQDDVLALVRRHAQERRSARTLSHKAEGLSALVMVAALAGPAAAGAGAAEGTADAAPDMGAASRRLLETVFGAESVDALVAGALAAFRERVDALMTEEKARLGAQIDVGVDPDLVPALRQALDRFETERGTA